MDEGGVRFEFAGEKRGKPANIAVQRKQRRRRSFNPDNGRPKGVDSRGTRGRESLRLRALDRLPA